MFKYPHTDFEKINLDWILRKIRQLEPAIPMVEESAAIVARVEQTAKDAAKAAQSAQTAVATVTAVAQEAKDTAEEAKEIAQQAASATIADGSVTWPKLDTAIQTIISDNADRSTAASSAAAAAQRTANSASTAASTAQQTANSANTAAAAAQQTANSASTAAATAQQTADSKTGRWTYAGELNKGDSVTCPATTQEVLVEVIDGRASVRSIATGVVRLDFSGSMQLYLYVVNVATYTMIDSTAKQVTFDPNLSAPTGIKAWVYYR